MSKIIYLALVYLLQINTLCLCSPLVYETANDDNNLITTTLAEQNMQSNISVTNKEILGSPHVEANNEVLEGFKLSKNISCFNGYDADDNIKHTYDESRNNMSLNMVKDNLVEKEHNLPDLSLFKDTSQSSEEYEEMDDAFLRKHNSLTASPFTLPMSDIPDMIPIFKPKRNLDVKVPSAQKPLNNVLSFSPIATPIQFYTQAYTDQRNQINASVQNTAYQNSGPLASYYNMQKATEILNDVTKLLPSGPETSKLKNLVNNVSDLNNAAKLVDNIIQDVRKTERTMMQTNQTPSSEILKIPMQVSQQNKLQDLYKGIGISNPVQVANVIQQQLLNHMRMQNTKVIANTENANIFTPNSRSEALSNVGVNSTPNSPTVIISSAPYKILDPSPKQLTPGAITVSNAALYTLPNTDPTFAINRSPPVTVTNNSFNDFRLLPSIYQSANQNNAIKSPSDNLEALKVLNQANIIPQNNEINKIKITEETENMLQKLIKQVTMVEKISNSLNILQEKTDNVIKDLSKLANLQPNYQNGQANDINIAMQRNSNEIGEINRMGVFNIPCQTARDILSDVPIDSNKQFVKEPTIINNTDNNANIVPFTKKSSDLAIVRSPNRNIDSLGKRMVLVPESKKFYKVYDDVIKEVTMKVLVPSWINE